MSDNQIEMMPYLSFQGNCEEALLFYSDILDGRIEIVSRYDNPAMNTPEDFKNKILHARFSFGKYNTKEEVDFTINRWGCMMKWLPKIFLTD